MVARNSKTTLTALTVLCISTLICEAQKGIASWYGAESAGKITASGETFSPRGFTAASWHYPFGTTLRVSYLDRYVVVRVNDRGPNRRFKNRVIDLSEASFAALADIKLGIIPVKIEKIKQ